MRRSPLPALGFLLLLGSAVLSVPAGHEPHVVTTRVWHLGNDATPEWPEAPLEPDGTSIEVDFEGRAFEGEGTLVLSQRHVNDAWHVEINGTRVATLSRGSEFVERSYALPAGVIRDGTNRFRLIGDVPTDDITVGDVRWFEVSFRELYDLVPVVVRVRDPAGEPLPARVTFTDLDDSPVELFYAQELHAAVRRGVAYTSDGVAELELPAGRYRVFALRGTEWSLARAEFSAEKPGASVELELTRELDTTGFVAADTHVHTLTYSGHGDASVEERLVTLAGEGVELAVATDHNHNTDYRPLQASMGLGRWFTPVTGNEVTTPIGHFNAFPLDPADEVPPFELTDVAAIVAGIRERGAKAVILNHPRWPDHEKGPHGVLRLDPYSGDWVGSWVASYDAMELINSQTEEREPMLLFRDWFALLNRGERVVGVGSSDSHTVGGVVGQGRTYVRSSTDDPAGIDVDECAENIARGRSSVSMGIFADLRLEGRSVLGETLSCAGALPGGLSLRVAAPSWVRPREVTLFANGLPIVKRMLDDMPALENPGPVDLALELDPRLPWPKHDFWLVAVVLGDGVGGAFWPQLNDYTLAATNPVQLDVDGDGICASPRAQAEALVERHGVDLGNVRSLLEEVDSAVAVQLLLRLRRAAQEEAEREVRELGAAYAERHPWLGAWAEARNEP